MNDAYLDRGKKLAGARDRRQVAAHELGHALGFCHKNPRSYVTIMAARFIDQHGLQVPSARDRANYHSL